MVSAPEFDPDSGQAKMGQIWVNSQKKVKTTPEPQGSEVVLSCQFFRKNSTIYTMDTAKLVRYAGSILQKGKRKPQVIKPRVFGRGGHFRCPFPYIEFTFPPKYEKRLSEYLLQLYY